MTIQFEHNAKFFFFFYKKKTYKLTIEFREATFEQFLQFTIDQEQNKSIDKWFFDFLCEHQVLEKGEKKITWKIFENFARDREGFQKLFNLINSIYFKGTKIGEKFDNFNVDKSKSESNDSMFLAYFLTNTSETVESLLKMTYSQILLIRDGVAFLNRGQTEKGQKNNDFIIRRRKAINEAEALPQEKKEQLNKAVIEDRQKYLNDLYQAGKFKKSD